LYLFEAIICGVAYQQFETVPIFSLGTYSLDIFSRFPSYLKVVLQS